MISHIRAFLRSEGVGRHLVRGSLASFFVQGAGAGLLFLSEVLLARVLGAENYGLYATISAWQQVLLIAVLIGSSSLLLRFVPIYVEASDWPKLRGLVRYCSRVSVALGFSLLLIAALVLAGVSDYVSDDAQLGYLIAMAILPIAALSIQRQAILRALHKVLLALMPEYIVRPIMLMMLVAMLAWVLDVDMRVPVVLAASGVAAVVAFLLGRYWMRQVMPAQVASAPTATEGSTWFRIATPLFLIAAVQLLIVRLDIILLGALTGHEQAGHYAAASRIADLVVFALASANVVVAPLIAGLHARNDIPGMQAMFVTLAKGVSLATIPLAALITLGGQAILGFFGNGYEAAYLPLLILACGQIVNALSGPVDFVMAMTGQQMKMLQILAAAAGLNLALNLLLIPMLGLAGAAIATACTTTFWNLYMRRVVRRRLGVDPSVMVLLRKCG